MGNSAIKLKLTQEQQEQIIAVAKAEAEPYIRVMSEIANLSIPTAIFKPDGTFTISHGYEENETYIIANGMVETIFERAQRKLNN